MRVQGTVGQTGGSRHVGDPHLVEPVLPQQPAGGLQQMFPVPDYNFF
jgi:hypothetical protein